MKFYLCSFSDLLIGIAMKSLLPIVCLLCGLFAGQVTLNAQLDNGSIAPDWTMTDVEGTEHNLYEILQSGRAVVIDVFATWCGPCWSFHQDGELKLLTEELGPEGSDLIRSFGIEGDPNTGIDHLYGNATPSEGDWITGNNYPTIDAPSGDFVDSYGIFAFPTVLLICPSGEITEIDPGMTHDDMIGLIQTCTFGTQDQDIGIAQLSSPAELECGSTLYEPIVRIQNLNGDGTPLTELTIDLYADDVLLSTTDWTGNLLAFQIEDVALPSFEVTDPFDLRIEISYPDDQESGNDQLETTIQAFPITENTITMDLALDLGPDELYWQVADEEGNVVAWGGNSSVGLDNIDNGYGQNVPVGAGTYTDNYSIVQEVIDLDATGCYIFTITDFVGDGIGQSLFANHSMRLTTSSGDEIALVPINVDFNPDFWARLDFQFYNESTTSTGGPALRPDLVKLAPNPTHDLLQVRLLDPENGTMTYELRNVLGRTVRQGSTQRAQSVELSLENLMPGVYWFSLLSAEGELLATERVIRQ